MTNTTLRVGPVTAGIKLQKVSTDLKARKWEVRKLDADGNVLGLKQPESVMLDAPVTLADLPMGEPAVDPVANAQVNMSQFVIPQSREQAIERDQIAAAGAPDVAVSQRGVTLADGTFVDLTDRLAAIDERTSLPGLQIVAAIARSRVNAERIRDAHYIIPQDDNAHRVLSLLYDALSRSGGSLIVRWTKVKNQALGVLVARPSQKCMVLLEVEYAEAMRPVPDTARLDTASLTEQEKLAAAKFIESLAGKKADLDAIRDERRALHDELLTAAKNGEAWALPEADSFDEDLAALLAAPDTVEA